MRPGVVPWRAYKAQRLARAGLFWLLMGFCGAILAAAALPVVVGARTYAVLSGSMSPAIETGDMVVADRIAPADARIGDIVTFRDPEGGSLLITHRVRSMRRDGRAFEFVTRGDANTGYERWSVPAAGEIGRVSYRVPRLGAVLGKVGGGPGRIVMILLPALVLCGLGLVRIWSAEAPGEEPRNAPA